MEVVRFFRREMSRQENPSSRQGNKALFVKIGSFCNRLLILSQPLGIVDFGITQPEVIAVFGPGIRTRKEQEHSEESGIWFHDVSGETGKPVSSMTDQVLE